MTEQRSGKRQSSIPPLRRVLLVGTAWMVGLRWTIKVAGLISTMILARLLTPADFGLVAMCMAIVAFVGVLFEFGTDYALINKADAEPAHYDAAWSLQVIQGVFGASLIMLLAPVVSNYYEDDRVLAMLLVLSSGVFIRSFANIGIVDFRKELQFSKEFIYLVAVKLITIPITIGLALWWRSYWALVAGIVISYAFEVAFSYLLHPMRPRFSLRKGHDIWSFSKWMILLKIANYITMKLDRFILGGLTSARQVGLYSLSGELAQVPSAELVAPVTRAVVPGFAKLKKDQRRLHAAFLKTVSAVAGVGIPASIGLAMVAGEVVPVILGSQWHDAVPLLRWLAVHGAILTLFSTSLNLLMVTDDIKLASLVAWSRALIFLTLVYPGFSIGGLLGVIYAKLTASFLGLCCLWTVIVNRRGISLGRIVAQVWRPAASAAVMALVLLYVERLNVSGAVFALAIKVSVGVAVYGITLMGLWFLFGKESGVERDLVALARRKIRRVAGA